MEKSSVEVPFIYTRSIGKRNNVVAVFAFRVSTNEEAVDITKDIVEQHVGEFIQLILLAKNRSSE